MKQCLLSLLLCIFCDLSKAAERPNVIVILCDDLGYGDQRCYNADSKIPTPNIDRLAVGGMRFTDAHTPSSVCTPTRYGLLTGRYSWRTFLKKGVLDGFDPPLIEPTRATLASFLKSHGYDTACIGKWHLGMTWTDTQGQPVPLRGDGDGHRGAVGADFTKATQGGPLDCGFDSWFGISASLDMPPYVYMEGRRATTVPSTTAPESKSLFLNQNAGPIADGFVLGNVLRDLTHHAVDYISTRAGKEKPFFLYLPLTSPHLPVVPAKEWQGRSSVGAYGDFVMETDSRLGEIMTALDQAKIADNTLILFTSDNGGLWHQWQAQETDDVKGYKPTPRAKFNAEHDHHSNSHLRGTKADIAEGGHRVPFIIHWPARVKAAQVSSALVELNDTFATLAEIIATPLPAEAAVDSISFLSVLEGGTAQRSFAVHHSLAGVFALREGPWKFVPSRGSGGFSTPKTVKITSGEPSTQLYHLTNDPSETHNLSATEPARITEMAARLSAIQASDHTRPEVKP
jgi:arylsulfatase A